MMAESGKWSTGSRIHLRILSMPSKFAFHDQFPEPIMIRPVSHS